jgi:hypothetical protein
MSEATVILPTVHINGTSRENLLADYQTSFDAVDNAINVLMAGGPNGRDYYMKAGAFEQARAEHLARLKKLHDVQEELHTIYTYLMNEG